MAVGVENIMRIKSLLISLFLLLTLSGFSAEAVMVDGIAYQRIYSTSRGGYVCYITARPDGLKYEGDIVIPEYVNLDGTNCPIVGVGDDAFKDCKELASITFLGVLDWIGNRAFMGCTNLNEFTIPPCYSNTAYEGLIDIGHSAFWGCHLTKLTSKIGVPPRYNCNNPSYFSTSYYYVTADWFGHDLDDRWYYDNYVLKIPITLYVPAGSLGAYRKKSEDRSEWGNISWGSGSDDCWGNLIGYSIKEIVEEGVDEDDPVPGLYNRIDELKPIYDEKERLVRDYSMRAYYFLLNTLYIIAENEGRDVTPLQQQLEASFEKEVAYGWREGYGDGEFEYKLIPSLKKTKDAIWSFIADATEKLEQLQAKRIAYYEARQAGNDKTAEELKSEINTAASEIEELLNGAALALEAFKEEQIQQETNEFFESFRTLITAVPTVKADGRLSNSPWYNINGQRMSGTPSTKGLYVRDGKKVIVK